MDKLLVFAPRLQWVHDWASRNSVPPQDVIPVYGIKSLLSTRGMRKFRYVWLACPEFSSLDELGAFMNALAGLELEEADLPKETRGSAVRREYGGASGLRARF